jgi:ketosteroid isomerase-like protein
MKNPSRIRIFVLTCALAALCVLGRAQQQEAQRRGAREPNADGRWTGVYRIDPARSDELYSVVAGASSNLPFGEQQKFFIDLTVRLTAPDQMAVERRGRRFSIASSRAPKITFEADGASRRERGDDGRMVTTRAALEGDKLSVSVVGERADRFHVTFEPIEGGRFLRVTRRLSADGLTEPVVIRNVYEKISGRAEWSIYGEPPRDDATGDRRARQAAGGAPRSGPADARRSSSPAPAAGARASAADAEEEARRLGDALGEWIEATNARDIERQMEFYAPVLSRFYLTSNATRAAVRAEKQRVFRGARGVDIRAAAPEIIFTEAGRAAVMRFRKTYAIENVAGARRSGEVVQELRWRQTPGGWKITSERDVRVIRAR